MKEYHLFVKDSSRPVSETCALESLCDPKNLLQRSEKRSSRVMALPGKKEEERGGGKCIKKDEVDQIVAHFLRKKTPDTLSS